MVQFYKRLVKIICAPRTSSGRGGKQVFVSTCFRPFGRGAVREKGKNVMMAEPQQENNNDEGCNIKPTNYPQYQRASLSHSHWGDGNRKLGA